VYFLVYCFFVYYVCFNLRVNKDEYISQSIERVGMTALSVMSLDVTLSGCAGHSAYRCVRVHLWWCGICYDVSMWKTISRLHHSMLLAWYAGHSLCNGQACPWNSVCFGNVSFFSSAKLFALMCNGHVLVKSATSVKRRPTRTKKVRRRQGNAEIAGLDIDGRMYGHLTELKLQNFIPWEDFYSVAQKAKLTSWTSQESSPVWPSSTTGLILDSNSCVQLVIP